MKDDISATSDHISFHIKVLTRDMKCTFQVHKNYDLTENADVESGLPSHPLCNANRTHVLH